MIYSFSLRRSCRCQPSIEWLALSTAALLPQRSIMELDARRGFCIGCSKCVKIYDLQAAIRSSES